MTFRFILISLLGIALLTGFRSDPSTLRFDDKVTVIHWESSAFLSWDDFQGRPNYKSHVSALTASAIEYSYECKGHTITYDVNAIFIPEESWVQSDAKTEYILAHEHLHFNITEVFARKLRKALKEEVKSCRDTYKIDRIARNVIKEWKAVQEQYDRDTHHSINEEAQASWEKKVERDLLTYIAYRD